MRVYVSGSSLELRRAREAMRLVSEAGHDLVLDWTRDIAAVGCAQGYRLSRARRREIAGRDLVAVDRCDLLWLLIPQYSSAGAWVEFGRAHAAGKRLIASGTPADRAPLFAELADHIFPTDAVAANYLRVSV